MYFTYKMFTNTNIRRIGFICCTLNNVCTRHTTGFATQHLLQSFTKTNPTLSNTIRSLSRTCTHTQHINTSTPTEANGHKQYTKAHTRGNDLGRYRTLLRQVPDFYRDFCTENEITRLLARRIFRNITESHKVHFTLPWRDVFIEKSLIRKSQHQSIPT